MTTKLEREIMRKLASKGGKTAAARMTPQQRTERARKAIETRWRKTNRDESETNK